MSTAPSLCRLRRPGSCGGYTMTSPAILLDVSCFHVSPNINTAATHTFVHEAFKAFGITS